MDVAEELTRFEPQIDKIHLERRILDWADRIGQLYGKVDAWLPPGWRSSVCGYVWMNEPLMRDHGIGARELPTLTLFHGDRKAGDLVPRALWIIGANGRVDLIQDAERFVIVDIADNFEPSHWKVSPFFERRKQRDFTSSSLQDILA